MSDRICCGYPLTTDCPFEADNAFRELVELQSKEIEELGVKVTGIHIHEEEASPRFFIEFPRGAGSFTFRSKLEAKQFDVGQQMGKEMLRFYATRRVKKGEGWQV